MTGGGSGGHITPILAVAHELKQLAPDIELVYIGQRGDSLSDIPAQSPYIDQVYTVRAGKFRRYHGEGLKQLLDVVTLLKNIRDAWWVVAGIFQSYRLMRKLRPSLIFSRGGFVSVPVCLGGLLQHVPYVTHDSDAVPSLANRLIAKWAVLHAVALPKELYAYPQNKTVTVGVPVQPEFQAVSPHQQKVFKKEIGMEHADKIVLLTGGGNGAQMLNDLLVELSPELFDAYPQLGIVHMAGRAHESVVQKMYGKLLTLSQRKQVVVKSFVNNLYAYSGAADVIITRAGATTLAEFAVQSKACIIIPSSFLAGGHQLKNAEYLMSQHAALCITEAQLEADQGALASAVKQLVDSPSEVRKLGQRLHKFAHPNAAKTLAALLLKYAGSSLKSK